VRRYLLIAVCLVLVSTTVAWADNITYSLVVTNISDAPHSISFTFSTLVGADTFDFAHAVGSGTLQDNDNNGVSLTDLSIVSKLASPPQDLGVTFNGPCDTNSCSFDLSNFFPAFTGPGTLSVEISFLLSAHDTFTLNGSTTISNEAPPSVPEPSSLMLLSSGVSAAFFGLRRRLSR
jgi:hypothetical protein